MLSGSPLVLRDTKPRVVLEFAPREPRGAPEPPVPSKMDDRIVAEVLAAAKLIGATVELLTDDTGMVLTARGEGLPFVLTPEEWRLPRENDKRDKEIADLRDQVKRLSRSAPRLELQASSGDLPLTAELPIRAMDYARLSAAVVSELIDALRQRYPEKMDFPRDSDDGYLLDKAQESAAFAQASYGLRILGPKT